MTEEQKARFTWLLARYGLTVESLQPGGAFDARATVNVQVDVQEIWELKNEAQSMGLQLAPLVRGLLRSFLSERRAIHRGEHEPQDFPPDHDRWGWQGPNRPVPETSDP